MLEHVHREVRVGQPIHRPDKRDDRDDEPHREQRDAIPTREIGSAASS